MSVADILGIIGIAVAVLFGIAGISSAIITKRQLDQITKTEKLLQADILNLEDATRRNLTGFAEIFARALWLMEKAEQEVWYINFLFGFGIPHKCNPNVVNDYGLISGVLKLSAIGAGDYSSAVDRFFQILLQKIQTTPKFYALVLEQGNLSKLFLERLKKIPNYGSLNGSEILEAEKSRLTQIDHAKKLRNVHRVNPDDFMLRFTQRIPQQLLIAQIPGRDRSERKWGCLVFLVGTENVGGVPMGFYTELDHVVDVYKSVAQSLLEA